MKVEVKLSKQESNGTVVLNKTFNSHSELIKDLNSDNIKNFFNPDKKQYEVSKSTPIGPSGEILFNNNTQTLKTTCAGLLVVDYVIRSSDYSQNFVWEECKRTELKPGDTAFRTTVCSEYPNRFSGFNICAIIDNESHWFITVLGNISRGNIYNLKQIIDTSSYWFKLVKKNPDQNKDNINIKCVSPVPTTRQKQINSNIIKNQKE